MPHLVFEHAEPLAAVLDIPALLRSTHALFCQLPTVNARDVKTRAMPAALFCVGQEATGLFLHVDVRVLEGRSFAELTHIQQAVVGHIKPLLPKDVVFTLEMRQMDKQFYFK